MWNSHGCISVTFMCVELSYACISVTFKCVELSHTCVSVTFMCVELSYACISVTFMCVELSEKIYVLYICILYTVTEMGFYFFLYLEHSD